MQSLVFILCASALVVHSNRISEQCQIEEGTRVICQCVGSEEFLLPEGQNYENVSSLQVSSCTTANLHFSSMVEATKLQEIVVQNISERLTFELFLLTKKIKTFKLTDIRRIPLITNYVFFKIRDIELFQIANTHIEYFEGQFNDTIVQNFVLVNVTIANMDRISFSGRGKGLRIIDSEFRNVSDNLNFSFFSGVEIIGSKFALNKPGHLLIEGNTVYLENSVFSNASTNLVAASKIFVNGSCADGKSSLRLSSDRVVSLNNRLPTEIIYTRDKRQFEPDHFLNKNNTVCIAGNCKCPKSSSQDHPQVSFHKIIFQLALVTILWAFV